MSWITKILHLYSQVTALSGNVIVKHINIILFDLLGRCHYILNPPRTCKTFDKHFKEMFLELSSNNHMNFVAVVAMSKE